MFKSKSSKINPGSTDTLIGVGTIIEGMLRSEASIRIEGKIIGDIEARGDVIIGENGSAQSNIIARDLVLAGNLVGSVSLSGKLTIMASGSLEGNISAQSFIIEAGGIFNGTSAMSVDKQSASPSKADNAAAASPAT